MLSPTSSHSPSSIAAPIPTPPSLPSGEPLVRLATLSTPDLIGHSHMAPSIHSNGSVNKASGDDWRMASRPPPRRDYEMSDPERDTASSTNSSASNQSRMPRSRGPTSIASSPNHSRTKTGRLWSGLASEIVHRSARLSDDDLEDADGRALPPPPVGFLHLDQTQRVAFTANRGIALPPLPPDVVIGPDSLAVDRLEILSNSSSDVSDDLQAYRNDRHFPPRLPAAPAHRPIHASKSMSSVKHIVTRVAQFEKSPDTPDLSDNRSRRTVEEGRVLRDSPHHVDDSVSASSGDDLEVLWQQLKERRAKLNDMRIDMARRRRELRDLRRRRDDADNAFMSLVRPLLVSKRGLTHVPIDLLDRRMEEMQKLRTDYHSLDSEYEGQELMLDEEEQGLNQVETMFFGMLAAGATRAKVAKKPTETEDDLYPSDVPHLLRGISKDGPQESLHPLYKELNAAVGDLGNARENYEELLVTKEQYEFDLDVRGYTGVTVREKAELDEFLEEFPSEEKRLKEEIAKYQQKVHELEESCEKKGVMRRHMSLQMAFLLGRIKHAEDMDLDKNEDILARTHHSLVHERFTELLSRPDHLIQEGLPLTPRQALDEANELPRDVPDRREKQQLAAKEQAIDQLLQPRVDVAALELSENDKLSTYVRSYRNADTSGTRADFVNRWLLQALRLSSLKATLLHWIFENECRLRIRDSWRWQQDVLHYWFRDGTSRTRFASSLGQSYALADNGTGSLHEKELARPSRVGTEPHDHPAPMYDILRHVRSWSPE